MQRRPGMRGAWGLRLCSCSSRCGQRRRRDPLIDAELLVGLVAHGEGEGGAVDKIGVADPETVEGLAVERDRLHVFLRGAGSLGLDGEGFAAGKVDLRALKKRRAQNVGATGGID